MVSLISISAVSATDNVNDCVAISDIDDSNAMTIDNETQETENEIIESTDISIDDEAQETDNEIIKSNAMTIDNEAQETDNEIIKSTDISIDNDAEDEIVNVIKEKNLIKEGDDSSESSSFNILSLLNRNGNLDLSKILDKTGINPDNITINIKELIEKTGINPDNITINTTELIEKIKANLDEKTINITEILEKAGIEPDNIAINTTEIFDKIKANLGEKTINITEILEKAGINLDTKTINLTELLEKAGIDLGNKTINLTELLDKFRENVDSKKFDISDLIKKLAPARKATNIVFENMTTTAVGPSDGRTGDYFYFKLTDANGNPIRNTPMQIGFNGKVYDYEHNNISTDENGIAKLQINLGYKGDYTFAICFLGNDDYNASFAVALIKVNVQKPKMTVPNKSYKASAKTKSLTVTFKTAKGNPIVGKSVKFTVNGKTYKAKTNDKGVATVKVSLNKKGTYNFTVKYGGDSTYTAVTQKAKLTIT